MVIFYVIALLSCFHFAFGAVQLDDFIEFGDGNDTVLKERIAKEHSLFPWGFRFGGEPMKNIVVNANGYVAFNGKSMPGSCHDKYCSVKFNDSVDERAVVRCDAPKRFSAVVPYGADVLGGFSGETTIYYRELIAFEDDQLLKTIQNKINMGFPEIDYIYGAFVVTWYQVGIAPWNDWRGGNTFQLILAIGSGVTKDEEYIKQHNTSNFVATYAVFLYNTLLPAMNYDGSEIFVGFTNKKHGSYLLKQSCNSNATLLVQESNCNSPGTFMFRIDQEKAISPPQVYRKPSPGFSLMKDCIYSAKQEGGFKNECPLNQRCIPNDPNCVIYQCEKPKGICLPKPHKPAVPHSPN